MAAAENTTTPAAAPAADAPHGPVPAPPEFAGQWLAPDDEQRFWQQDTMHFPEPLTELDDLLLQIMYRDALAEVATAYDLPIRPRHRRIGTYHYLAVVQLTLHPTSSTPWAPALRSASEQDGAPGGVVAHRLAAGDTSQLAVVAVA